MVQLINLIPFFTFNFLCVCVFCRWSGHTDNELRYHNIQIHENFQYHKTTDRYTMPQCKDKDIHAIHKKLGSRCSALWVGRFFLLLSSSNDFCIQRKPMEQTNHNFAWHLTIIENVNGFYKRGWENVSVSLCCALWMCVHKTLDTWHHNKKLIHKSFYVEWISFIYSKTETAFPSEFFVMFCVKGWISERNQQI